MPYTHDFDRHCGFCLEKDQVVGPYANPSDLKEHERSMHSKWQCSHCKTFHDTLWFMNECYQSHTDTKLGTKCEVCKLYFTGDKNKCNHTNLVTGEPCGVPCSLEECKQRFYNSFIRSSHRSGSHTRYQEGSSSFVHITGGCSLTAVKEVTTNEVLDLLEKPNLTASDAISDSNGIL